MNEQGKKLIEDFRWEARTKEVTPSFFGYSFTPDELERFAELIILKCGEIADDSVDHGLPSVYIERYFGVE